MRSSISKRPHVPDEQVFVLAALLCCTCHLHDEVTQNDEKSVWSRKLDPRACSPFKRCRHASLCTDSSCGGGNRTQSSLWLSQHRSLLGQESEHAFQSLRTQQRLMQTYYDAYRGSIDDLTLICCQLCYARQTHEFEVGVTLAGSGESRCLRPVRSSYPDQSMPVCPWN